MLSKYELQRLSNIERNNGVLAQLGLAPSGAAGPSSAPAKKKKKKKKKSPHTLVPIRASSRDRKVRRFQNLSGLDTSAGRSTERKWNQGDDSSSDSDASDLSYESEDLTWMHAKKRKKKKAHQQQPPGPGKRARRPVSNIVQQQQAARWPKARERSAVTTALVALGAIPATELSGAARGASDVEADDVEPTDVEPTDVEPTGLAAVVDSVTDTDAASQLLDFSSLPASDPFQSSVSPSPQPSLPLPGPIKVACPVCGGMFKPKGGTHHRKHQDVEYGGDCRGSGLPIADASLS